MLEENGGWEISFLESEKRRRGFSTMGKTNFCLCFSPENQLFGVEKSCSAPRDHGGDPYLKKSGGWKINFLGSKNPARPSATMGGTLT